MKVAIIPGHGGHDSGGTGPNATGGLMKESKINLNVALKLKELLELKGITVAISRTDDGDYLSPGAQQAFVNGSKADYAIAIHQNDSEHETAQGYEVFYQPGSFKSKKLADLVYLEFGNLGGKGRGVKTFERKVAVMGAKVPTILTERVFLTKADAHRTDELREQWNEAKALFNALMAIEGRYSERLAYDK